MTKIFIIEDEVMIRDLLAEYVVTLDQEWQVVGSNGDGEEALRECLEVAPDIAIVDIRLPNLNGLEILHLLKRKLPQTKVLIFTGVADSKSINLAIKGRVDGFVEKGSGITEIKEAIEALAAGRHYFTPRVYRQIWSHTSQ